MRSFLLLSICLLFVFSSCSKKTGTASPGTMSATTDGVNLNFSTGAAAHLTTDATGTSGNLLHIYGATASSGNKQLIDIDVTAFSPITSGTYVSSDTNQKVASSQIIYSTSAAGSQASQTYITDNYRPSSTTVTITSITGTRVQGTFSGALVNSIAGGQPKSVTNGTFDVAIQ